MQSQVIAIVIAAVAMFLFGAVWYSPVLFAKIWSRETGITGHRTDRRIKARFFVILLALCLLAAAVLDGLLINWMPGRGLSRGLSVGFLSGLLAVSGIGMHNLFERKSLTLFLVNAGYNLVGFSIMGVLIAVI